MFKNIFFGFLFSGALLFNVTGSSADPQLGSVDIHVLPAQASSVLSQLRHFDIAGYDWKRGVARVILPESKVGEVAQLGLQMDEWQPLANTLRGPKGYMTPDVVVKNVLAFKKTYPEIVQVEEIGRSRENRPLYSVTLTDPNGASDKPVVLFNAMHHAREVMTTEIAMHMIEVLAQGFGTDPEVTRWLREYKIVVVPQVNPDGNNLVHTGQPWWRKNAYRRVGVVGVDLNRNYPALWNSCHGSSSNVDDETFRGDAPASEPESRAMMNLVTKIRPVANLSYHSFGEMILFPYGCQNQSNPAKDLFFQIGVQLSRELTSDAGKHLDYEVGESGSTLYEADGTDTDWHWQQWGVLSYTVEVNDEEQNFEPDYATWRDVTVVRQEGGWKQLLRRLETQGVRAKIETTNLDSVRYRIYVKNGGHLKAWSTSDLGEKEMPLRNGGLLYQPLMRGDYKIVFSQGRVELLSKDVHIDDELVDWGTLSL